MDSLLKKNGKLEVIYAVTSSVSLVLLRGLASRLLERKLSCVLLTGAGPELEQSDLVENIKIII